MSVSIHNDVMTAIAVHLQAIVQRSGPTKWQPIENPPGMEYIRHASGMEVHSGWNRTDGLRWRAVDKRGGGYVMHLWRATLAEAFDDAELAINVPLVDVPAETAVRYESDAPVGVHMPTRTVRLNEVPVKKMTITELLQSLGGRNTDPQFWKVRDEIVRRQQVKALEAARASVAVARSEALEQAAGRVKKKLEECRYETGLPFSDRWIDSLAAEIRTYMDRLADQPRAGGYVPPSAPPAPPAEDPRIAALCYLILGLGDIQQIPRTHHADSKSLAAYRVIAPEDAAFWAERRASR